MSSTTEATTKSIPTKTVEEEVQQQQQLMEQQHHEHGENQPPPPVVTNNGLLHHSTSIVNVLEIQTVEVEQEEKDDPKLNYHHPPPLTKKGLYHGGDNNIDYDYDSVVILDDNDVDIEKKVHDKTTTTIVAIDFPKPPPYLFQHLDTTTTTTSTEITVSQIKYDMNLVRNLMSQSYHAKVLYATDEWFAIADHLCKDTPPYFDPNEYCQQGKVMDGWETRRRREMGHDWCIIKLGQPPLSHSPSQFEQNSLYQIMGIEIDTGFFTGNNVPAISIEMCSIENCLTELEMIQQFPNIVPRLLYGTGIQGMGNTPEQVQQANHACYNTPNVHWYPLLEKTSLQPGYEHSRYHYFPIAPNKNKNITMGTHIRINYYPDGGVARIRLWGYPIHDILRQQQELQVQVPIVQQNFLSTYTYPIPVAGPAYSPISTCDICTVVPHSSIMTDEHTLLPSQETLRSITKMATSSNNPIIELSSQENGGVGLMCSNKHYGNPFNLIQYDYGVDMGDGWETARHPNRLEQIICNPNTGLVDSTLHDWCIIQLGSPTQNISRIILDTKHFRGNYPESVQVDACYCTNNDELLSLLNHDNEEQEQKEEEDYNDSIQQPVQWFPLIDRVRMAPDSEHVFDSNKNQIRFFYDDHDNNDNETNQSHRMISHIRISIYPDGGLSRVRVYGTPVVDPIINTPILY